MTAMDKQQQSMSDRLPKLQWTDVWRGIIQAKWLIAVAYILAVQVILALIAISYNNDVPVWAITLGAIIGTTIMTTIAKKHINRLPQHQINKKPLRISLVLLAPIFITALLYVIATIANALNVEPAKQQNQASLDSLIGVTPLAMLIVIIILAPIIEEFIFRHYIPYIFGGSFIAYVAGSMLFVMMHMPNGIIGWSSYGAISAVLLFVRLRNQNLYASIAAHMLWNAVTLYI